jgi:uncharacterized integral membrane protein
MHTLKIIIIIVLLAFVALFTFQNTAVAEVRFLVWTVSLSVSLMLLASLFSGILLGLLLSYTHNWRKNRRLKNAGMPGSSFSDTGSR